MQTPAGPRQRTDPYSDAATQFADDAAGEIGPGVDHVAAADSAPSGPIFVDASGRRRKLARRASLAAVAVLAGYTGLLAVSFAGGPIPPNALLPVPGIPAGRQQAPASTAPAGAVPSAKSSADHAAEAGRSTTGASGHRVEPRTTTANGSVRQSAPSQPQPATSASTTASSPAAPPTPTGTTSAPPTPANTHGNPTPPGHTRHT